MKGNWPRLAQSRFCLICYWILIGNKRQLASAGSEQILVDLITKRCYSEDAACQWDRSCSNAVAHTSMYFQWLPRSAHNSSCCKPASLPCPESANTYSFLMIFNRFHYIFNAEVDRRANTCLKEGCIVAWYRKHTYFTSVLSVVEALERLGRPFTKPNR